MLDRGLIIFLKQLFKYHKYFRVLYGFILNDGVKQIIEIKDGTYQHLFPMFNDEWMHRLQPSCILLNFVACFCG